MTPPTVLLIGTLDTKGEEYAFLRDRLIQEGVEVCIADVGVLGEPRVQPDISRDTIAILAGTTVQELVQRGDRGQAVAQMAEGAARLAVDLLAKGRLHGALGLGGTGGTTLITTAMRALPVGVPRLMVSTVASGDTRPYVGASDITMTYSVVDIAGVNKVSAPILANAAAAMAGMVKRPPVSLDAERPVIGATMFGVTTPCVDVARRRLEELGYEVLVFHATGTGGQSMESLVRSGMLAGVLDITTTELADDLVGGVFSAGPQRLEAAGEAGLPQVVSLGALDMVNFGPRDSVPERFQSRRLHVHNPTVTLMRTTPDECAELGKRIAVKLSAARGPVTLFVPRGGVSLIDVPGQPFHDPEADAALFEAIHANVQGAVEIQERDTHINDPVFARSMADKLHELCSRTAVRT